MPLIIGRFNGQAVLVGGVRVEVVSIDAASREVGLLVGGDRFARLTPASPVPVPEASADSAIHLHGLAASRVELRIVAPGVRVDRAEGYEPGRHRPPRPGRG